jgi:hypothetical protein
MIGIFADDPDSPARFQQPLDFLNDAASHQAYLMRGAASHCADQSTVGQQWGI